MLEPGTGTEALPYLMRQPYPGAVNLNHITLW